jgi:hypothetical protein
LACLAEGNQFVKASFLYENSVVIRIRRPPNSVSFTFSIDFLSAAFKVFTDISASPAQTLAQASAKPLAAWRDIMTQ